MLLEYAAGGGADTSSRLLRVLMERSLRDASLMFHVKRIQESAA